MSPGPSKACNPPVDWEAPRKISQVFIKSKSFEHDYHVPMQSLALAHADVKDDGVIFTPWKETDFRTNEKPWWV